MSRKSRTTGLLNLTTLVLLCVGLVEDVMARNENPEAALSALYEAYRNKDIEAAVATRDFTSYAKQMISELDAKGQAGYQEAVAEMADTLELAYRAEIDELGFVDMSLVVCRVIEKLEISPITVELVEECKFLDNGELATSRLTVHRSEDGWRIGQISD